MAPKSKIWTVEDDQYLKDNFHTKTNQELGDYFGIGKYAIKYRAKILKLKRIKSYEKINIGDRFTDLVVLNKESKRGKWYVKCTCICGKIVDKTIESLLSGRTKGCGCYTWKIALNSSGMVSYKHSYRVYIKNAKTYNRDFSLTLEEFINLITQNCFYCNEKPRLFNMYLNSKGNTNSPYKNRSLISIKTADVYINGIDRVDNSRGYTLDNSVACCWGCNSMKKALGLYEWCAFIERFQLGFTEKMLEKLEKVGIKLPPKEKA